MHKNEAVWLACGLSGIDAAMLSPMLDIGSSTRHYREVEQPWVEEFLFAPLRRRGIRVVHCDVKTGEGVDLVADIFDDADMERLKALGARAVLCCNMMEHVIDPAALAQRCLALVPGGGHVAATVPHSYPYHRDPIDTGFRPTPDELIALFGGGGALRLLHSASSPPVPIAIMSRPGPGSSCAMSCASRFRSSPSRAGRGP